MRKKKRHWKSVHLFLYDIIVCHVMHARTHTHTHTDPASHSSTNTHIHTPSHSASSIQEIIYFRCTYKKKDQERKRKVFWAFFRLFVSFISSARLTLSCSEHRAYHENDCSFSKSLAIQIFFLSNNIFLKSYFLFLIYYSLIWFPCSFLRCAIICMDRLDKNIPHTISPSCSSRYLCSFSGVHLKLRTGYISCHNWNLKYFKRHCFQFQLISSCHHRTHQAHRDFLIFSVESRMYWILFTLRNKNTHTIFPSSNIFKNIHPFVFFYVYMATLLCGILLYTCSWHKLSGQSFFHVREWIFSSYFSFVISNSDSNSNWGNEN